MKKIIVLTLLSSMLLFNVACNNVQGDRQVDTEVQETVGTEIEDTDATIEEVENQESAESAVVTSTYNTGDFKADAERFFLDASVNTNGSFDWMRATAVQLGVECGVPFEIMPVDVEPGLLTGFDNIEITGFNKGVMFGPMIGSIPFVGYIFGLDDNTDVVEFTNNLINNANLRWNVCTSADTITCTSINTGEYGELVLFIMHPASFSEEGTETVDGVVEVE